MSYKSKGMRFGKGSSTRVVKKGKGTYLAQRRLFTVSPGTKKSGGGGLKGNQRKDPRTGRFT